MECRLMEIYSLQPGTNLAIRQEKRIQVHWICPVGRSGYPCTKQRLTKRPSGSVNQKTLLGFIVIYSFLYLFVVHSINLSINLVIDKQRSMTGPFMHNAMKNTQKERPWHNLRYWYNILSEKLRQIAKIPVIGQNF